MGDYNVYLSGWEYNRLLQHDPIIARNSALPASIFWKGAHQLWLFKTIYCTRESLKNEYAASETLGWASGKILEDLVYEGIVEGVAWADLPANVKDQLRAGHSKLRQEFSPDIVRSFIDRRDTTQLELIKGQLLAPLLRHYKCVGSGEPNSLSNWASVSRDSHTLAATPTMQEHLYSLAAPLVPGLQVCNPPAQD